MKVVTRQELIRMPAGTLYHEWKPCYFGDLCIKGESIEHPGKGLQDWWEQSVPQVDGPSPMDGLTGLDDGKTVALDFDCMGRDALFDDEIRYAVWSREDVTALRDRLTKALRDSGGSEAALPPVRWWTIDEFSGDPRTNFVVDALARREQAE